MAAVLKSSQNCNVTVNVLREGVINQEQNFILEGGLVLFNHK